MEMVIWVYLMMILIFPYNPYDAIVDENLTWVTLGSTNVTPPLYLYKPNGSYSI